MKKSETFVDNTAQIFMVFSLFGVLANSAELIWFHQMGGLLADDPRFARFDMGLYHCSHLALDVLGAFLAVGLLKRKTATYRPFLGYCLLLAALEIVWAVKNAFLARDPQFDDPSFWADRPILRATAVVLGWFWVAAVTGVLVWVWARFRTQAVRSLFKER